MSRHTPSTLTYVPLRNQKARYAVKTGGLVTVTVPPKFPWQEEKLVPLKEAPSFLWLHMDGTRNVQDLIDLFRQEYPNVKDPEPKVLKFLSTLREKGLIIYD